ncbi:MAG: FAD-dependent oxidoreductase, partial [Bdellovibrionota bacterium]
YIGLELWTFFAKICVSVTVIEAGPTLLPGVDPELSRVVQRKLEKRGVKILLNAKAQNPKDTGNGVEVLLAGSNQADPQLFDRILVTVGRVPNTDGIGLEKLGLKLDAKGFIPVNSRRQTALPHVFAIGDVAGQPLLAHKGSKEGIVAAEAIAGLPTIYDVVAMPAVIFTDPEIATVGLTEAEARAKPGVDVMIGNFPLAANGRALSMSAGEGFVKTVGDRKTGRLLGVHIVGAEASNIISEAAFALELGAQVEDLALTVHPHPTLGESLMESAEAALGHAIHIFQKKPADAGVGRRV